ncbi:hypothetical protein BH11BAC7_BH11BAC7_11420 [soil metagenome]
MKYRSIHPNREPRKQTSCICKFCGELFTSERSDSEYCSNSHKVTAYHNRKKEKWRKSELGQRKKIESYEKQYVINKLASQPVSLKPPLPLPSEKTQSSFFDEFITKHNQNMDEMHKRNERERELNAIKNDIERKESLFISIANLLIQCSEHGYIRHYDIRKLQNNRTAILDNEKIQDDEVFSQKFKYIENILSDYIEEVDDLERESTSRIMEFELPDEIYSGLQMLLKPIPFPQA